MIGHSSVRTYLEQQLPPATLLHGPQSIGKWTLARHVADHHRIAPIDRWEVTHGLTIDTVRLITSFAARSPQGTYKLIVARLDDSSTPALNALLKTLEEPPPKVRFLLISSGRTLPTVASRCVVFELGYLTGTELEAVYREQGVPSNKAHRAATYARGQVKRGFDLDAADAHRHQVVNLAKALATGDRDLFHAVFTGWDGRSNDMLTTFFTECLTHRWNTFTDQDTFGLHRDRTRLWRMVRAVTLLPSARARLATRVALEPFLAR